MSTSLSSAEQEVGAASRLLRQLKYLAVVGGVCAAVVLSLYFYNFHGALAAKSDEWGQFGDFVGGVLNPAFSFLALFALLATFALQVRQLRMSANELRNSAEALIKQEQVQLRQNFESSFFQLLRLHNDIVNSIDLVSEEGRMTRGRDCLRVFLKRLELKLTQAGALRDFEAFVVTYNVFHADHEHEIGHYFRLLYNIVKLVKRTEGIDKKYYTNLVRAQLSSAELKLLFYNCLSNWGAEKFKPMVEEFALLKTIPRTALPDRLLLQMYKPEAFGGSYP